MTATINLELHDPGVLAFKGKVRCRATVDGAEAATLGIGETVTFTAAPGRRDVRVLLAMGPIIRRSNRLRPLLADGDAVHIVGTYSRLWGTYRIRIAPA